MHTINNNDSDQKKAVLSKRVVIVRLESLLYCSASSGKGDGLPGTQNLQSMTGIGKLSSAIILCTIGNIAHFESTNKRAVYAGLVPRVNESELGLERRGGAGRQTIATVRKTLEIVDDTVLFSPKRGMERGRFFGPNLDCYQRRRI